MITVKNNNGSITISDIVNNQLEKQTYYGYSIKDSKNKFKNYLIGKKFARLI